MSKSKAWVMMFKPNEEETECNLELYPLVICKDCKWHSEKGFCKHPDGYAGKIRPVDWFCAYGEME